MYLYRYSNRHPPREVVPAVEDDAPIWLSDSGQIMASRPTTGLDEVRLATADDAQAICRARAAVYAAEQCLRHVIEMARQVGGPT